MPHYITSNASAALAFLTDHVAIVIRKAFLTGGAIGEATALEFATG